jgi:aconitate hydratase
LQAENNLSLLQLAAGRKELGDIARLPKSLKVLLENLLRWQDGDSVTEEDIRALAGWLKTAHADREIAYRPARVLMQDFTGVPAVVDLAAMREAVKRLGGDTAKVNPLSPVDLVIDHSVTVDRFGDDDAFEENVRLEMERNHERYVFCAGDSRRSAVLASRRAPVFATRLTWNIWQSGLERITGKEWVAYPDAGGYRLPYHDDQRSRRAGLGRRGD